MTIGTEPARRHRCELCKEVFECHLCEINLDHPTHRPSIFDPESRFYICEDCCGDKNKRFQPRYNRFYKDYYMYTDMLTGEVNVSRKRMWEILKSA